MSNDGVEQGTDQAAPSGPLCSNCGTAFLAGQSHCPNCGQEAQPPTPVLSGTPEKERYTAKQWLALFGGVLVALASPFVLGLGIVAVFIAYIVMRKQGTPFVRGMGIGLIISGAILLGALGICVWFFVAESQQHR